MAAVNDQTELAALFKQAFGDKVIDVFPNITKVSRLFSHQYAEALGKYLRFPVQVAEEHGVTYAAGTTGAPTLLPPTAGELQDAQVDGAQMFARSRIDYGSMMRGKSAGPKAFAASLEHVVKLLIKACGKRLEASTLHGQQGWGAIESITGSGTTRAWVITEATWSAGLWAGAKNMTLDTWAAALTGSKINTNAKVVVTGVARSTRTISVSGNATDLTNTLVGMHLFPETASPTNEFAGIGKILANTGTLFNIDASVYDVWKGNISTISGAISMAGVLNGVRLAAEMGLVQDVVAIVSPRAFQVLNDDLAALRRFDSSYSTKESESGTEEIIYIGQTGRVRIMPHLYQKDGQVYIIAPKEWKRVGATDDFGFITRHGDSEKLIYELADTAAAEMRCGFIGAIVCEAPSHQVLLNGITYS